MYRKRLGGMAAAIAALTIFESADAQTGAVLACSDAAADSCVDGERVVYRPSYFTQFNPITALDMVRRVPGFSIDEGDNVRGFIGAAGNVLIDGQRPSTKSADIFTILSRIGAGAVDRIELIRGGTGGLDVGGQSVVVNVVRKSGEAGGDPSLWEFALLKRRPNGGVRPAGEVSFNGRRGDTKYTIGADAFGFALRFEGEEEITRFTGPDERRIRDGRFHEQGGGANLKLEHSLSNADTARFSFETGYFRSREDTDETRFLEVGGPDLALFTFPFELFRYELGADYEHAFTENFDGKLIAVFGRESESFESGFEFLPAMGAGDRSIFFSDRTSGETIGRAEFGYKGFKRHSIQFGGEFAKNFIDSTAELVADDGTGMLTPVPLNGANTRVTELRGEPFVNDSWKINPKLTLDAAFAVEFSSISQSGDNANSRFFTYPKPSLKLTYAPAPTTQWRVSAARTVNQLSFDQFVSSVNFDDEDVDFGNPDLQPQRAWEFELTYERRFGDIGVAELTGFYNLVQDVEDLLPIGGIVEVPGNIGDGAVYGATLKLTAPLDWLFLPDARIESETTWRDSSVTDPVTGADRDFSFTPDLLYEFEFRQDFPAHRSSWGFSFQRVDERLGFGLDEISEFRQENDINVYVETTKIKGIKARFEINDVINVTNFRDRTVFDGSRADDIALFREERRSNNGGGLRLILSGTF